MNKFDSSKDYYEVLGVSEDATAEEIERAYRNEARNRHPDFGGSPEEMISLNEANDILSDPETRAAYDAESRPETYGLGSSMAWDPEAASRAGALKIPVADGELTGLVLGAATCFGVGLPLLILIEMQWVFFLWPLRILSLGALGLGVFLSHSALGARRRKLRLEKPARSPGPVVFEELAFWIVTVGGLGLLMFALYTG